MSLFLGWMLRATMPSLIKFPPTGMRSVLHYIGVGIELRGVSKSKEVWLR